MSGRIGQQLDQLLQLPPAGLFAQLEELIVRRALNRAGSNQVRAAKLLGISRNILRTQLKRFGLLGSEAHTDTQPA